MSRKVIDYYLTINSPWAYLGAARLASMADNYGCEVKVYPTKIMDVFGQTGGVPLAKRAPERQAYRLVELERWSKFLDISITINPQYFPADDTLAAQAVIAAQAQGLDGLGLSRELGRAQWELEQDFSHMGTIAAACARAGIELAGLGELGDYADTFETNTKQAIARGVFGYPAYFYDDEMFWGQDRLDFLEHRLAICD